jgi:hypothetical protein
VLHDILHPDRPMPPFSDRRDPPVVDPFATMPRAEQEQRCADIEAIGYLVDQYGLDQVRQWIGAPPVQTNPIREVVDRYGVDTVLRWVRYFAWKAGRA